MADRYLLPCPCGKTIPVQAAQAGDLLRCECGREIEAPTLLKLRLLPVVADATDRREEANWGAWHGMALVSVVVATFAAGFAIYFLCNRPKPPEAAVATKMIHRYLDKDITLLQSYDAWEELRFGLYTKRPSNVAYQAAMKDYWIRMGVSLTIFGVAWLITIAAVVMALRQKRQRLSNHDDQHS